MKKIYAGILSMVISTLVFAQEKSTDINVDVNKNGGNWYASPWVWVVGAAVFILLLVALTSGGRSRSSGNSSGEKVTVTKTVRRDTDV